MFSAAVWNSGATTRVRSSAREVHVDQDVDAFQVMLPWVSTAPLGRPVVPEVYMIRQGSSRRDRLVARLRRAPASSSS